MRDPSLLQDTVDLCHGREAFVEGAMRVLEGTRRIGPQCRADGTQPRREPLRVGAGLAGCGS